MSFLRHTSVKTKLTALVAIPFAFFLVFAVIEIVQNGMQISNTLWNKKLREATVPFIDLVDNLEKEATLSIASTISEKEINLSDTRLLFDQQYLAFKEATASLNGKEFNYLEVFLDRIQAEMGKLDDVRGKVDRGEISSVELNNFYTDIQKIAFSAIDATDSLFFLVDDFTKQQRAYYFVLKMRFMLQQQTVLMQVALLENTISEKSLIELASLSRADTVYEGSSFVFASQDQKALIEETLSNPVFAKADEMVDTVLLKNIRGDYGFTAKEWASVSNQKIQALGVLLKQLKTGLKTLVNNRLTKNIVWICILSGIIIIITFLICLLSILIVRDLLKTIHNLRSNSHRIEKKDLSKAILVSDRRDELGILEKSFAAIVHTVLKILIGLQKEVQVITEGSSGIVDSLRDLSVGQTETENSIVETNATMEELRQISGIANQHADEVLKIAGESTNALQQSLDAIRNTLFDLNEIQDKMGIISESTTKFNEHCLAIGSIIDSVHNIAEQSHVLAINASIEAAKAGEHGKGFAVVAEEVKNLADQSKQATSKVNTILTDIQNAMNSTVLATEQGSSAVKKGVEQSSYTTDVMNLLAESVKTVLNVSKEMTASIEQQFSAVSQTTEAINNIRTASTNQTKLTQAIERTTVELHQVAEHLGNLIGEFKLPEEDS